MIIRSSEWIPNTNFMNKIAYYFHCAAESSFSWIWSDFTDIMKANGYRAFCIFCTFWHSICCEMLNVSLEVRKNYLKWPIYLKWHRTDASSNTCKRLIRLSVVFRMNMSWFIKYGRQNIFFRFFFLNCFI